MVASLCMEKSEEWETGYRYLTIEKLGQDDDYQQNSPIRKSMVPPVKRHPTSADLISKPILQKI